MPTRPRTLGSKPQAERRRRYDAERMRAKPWRSWYGRAEWKDIRAAQLERQPLCEPCLTKGRTVTATVCNHKVPHRGDWQLFIKGPFESCCKPCHDGPVQSEERRGER